MTKSIETVIDPNFDWWEETDQTIYCKCGGVFRGRCKLTQNEDKTNLLQIVDRNCPICDDLKITRVSSDPETFTLKG